ncbi:MAG: choice-of-anchor J domain-containing protein [Acetatifactor sp.]|nr:choice-of-anchor J domain-containing protein [Acetatifactor sp.]
MKRKTYRLLAMLLAFVLTFTAAGMDVLAAGVEAGEARTTEDAAIAAENAQSAEVEESEADEADAGDEAEAGVESVAATQEEAEVPAAEGQESAKSAEGAEAVEAAGIETKAAEAEAVLKDAAETAQSAEVEGSEADDAAAEDAAEIAEDEGETVAEVGSSPRLRSFGAPKSLSLSSTGFSEGFEGSDIPEGWTLETDTENYNWETSSSCHSGSRAAYMKYLKNSDGETAWLITPTFDFSNVTGFLMLSFWYKNRIYEEKFEELSVCYRVSGGEWQELFKTESGHDDWTKTIMLLPEEAKKSGVEIGFKGVNHDGIGLCLDDVLLKEVEEIQYCDLTYHANGGSGTMTDANSPYYEGASATALPNGFTAPNHKYFNSWNTKADGSGAKYYPGDDFEVTGNVTIYAQWTDAASGLNESFERGTGLPGGWTVVADDDGKQWSVVEPMFIMYVHSGTRMALMENGTSWLITPSLDLRGTDNSWFLSFWYSNLEPDDFGAYYRVNGGDWKKLFQADEVYSNYAEQRILLPEEAMAENVEIGFKATCTDGSVFLDDVVLQRTENVVYVISISDEITDGAVKTDKIFAEAGETVTLTVMPGSFARLKTLTVKKGSTSISTTKVNETEYTFVMPDGNVTVDATFQLPEGMAFSEDFEGEELPGWTFVDADGDGFEWELYNGSNMRIHSGSGILYSESYNSVSSSALTPDNWAITPGFTVPEAAVLSFWIKGQDANYPEEKMAVYAGLSPNVSDMVKVGGDYVGTPEYRQYFVDLSAYEGKKIYVGFRHYNVTDMFVLNLDDVAVQRNDNVSTLTFDANGGSGERAQLSFVNGQTTSMVSCMFTAPEGKVFSGWNTKADGSGESYQAGDSYVVAGNATLYAQWIDVIYQEDFQGIGIPAGWVLLDEDGDQNNWMWEEVLVGHASPGALISFSYDQVALTPDNWAIMPSVVPSANSVLSFWIKGISKDYPEEKMAVYIGSSTDVESMTKVGGDYTATATYQKYEIDLSAYAGQEIYVAFRHYNVTDMYCIGLDDIMVTGDANAVAKYSVTYDANGGSGAMTDPGSPYDKDTQATVMSNAFMAPTGKRFVSWNTKADESGTTYQPGDRFAVTNNVRLYAQWEDVPIELPTQLKEGFENSSLPAGWKVESDGHDWTIATRTENGGIRPWNGYRCAALLHETTNTSGWLITPALDLSYGSTSELSFRYNNYSAGAAKNTLKVCYRVDGGEWIVLFQTEKLTFAAWELVEMDLPQEAKKRNVEIGFYATDAGWGNYVGLDDVYVTTGYKITTDVTGDGSISKGLSIAYAGKSILLSFSEGSNYKLAEVELIAANGQTLELERKPYDVYTFIMPECDVTIKATFVENGTTYDYPLKVAGTTVNVANANDVLGDGAVAYDAITKVLTLKKDVTSDGADGITSDIDGLTIVTEKALTIKSNYDDAIQLTGATKIQTNGQLTLIGNTSGGGYGIYVRSGNLEIEDSSLSVAGRIGLFNNAGYHILIKNSYVFIKANNNAGCRIVLEDCALLQPVGGSIDSEGKIYNAAGRTALTACISPVTEVTAESPYEEGFEKDGMPEGWTFSDADDDGYGWKRYSESDAIRHSGDAVLASESFSNADNVALTPDNWAFLPALRLPENAELSFWLAAQLDNWTGDVLGVYVGTTLNPEDMTQLGEDFEAPAAYTEYKIDLSEYAGQSVFIAFRHYNCEDCFQLNLDDVKVGVKTLTDENLVISKKSLTLYDTISIEFKVPETAFEGYHDPYLEATQNGKTSRIYEYRTEGGLRIFTYRVAPHMLGEAVTAVPHALNADGVDVTGVAMTYSVTEYCYNQLGKETYQTERWAPFRRLLVDILLYGDAAQKYVGYKTDELPSRNLTSAQRAMGTDVTVPMVYNNVKDVNYAVVGDSDRKAEIKTAALYLEAAVNIQFKFTADDLNGLKVVISDDAGVLQELTPNPSDKDTNGRYYVTFGNLNAGEMRKTVYATVMQGTKKVSNTMQYSIESYAAAQSNSTVANLPELLHAMMRYGDSARAFLDAN